MNLRRPPSALVVIDDNIDHAAIALRVAALVAPDLATQAVTDVRLARQVVVDAPDGALVLVDRRLASGDGSDLVRRSRYARPDLRFVLMSAVIDDVDRREALAAGAEDAIEKPLRLDGWRTLFERLLRPSRM